MNDAESDSAGGPVWFRRLATGLLTLGFLWFICPGLLARFTPDDIMNLHAAWAPPWRELLVQAAFPWLPGVRPVGGVLYRASFEVFGFNLLAFRILLTALLGWNVWLTARLAARIAGNAWAGWFAASLSLYHLNFQALYWNTGTCYDILAFSGTWWAAWVTLRARTERIGAWKWVAAGVAYWLALGAKEIALALPAILLAFELLPGRRQWTALAVSTVVAGGCVVGRIYGGGGILTHPLYVPEFSVTAYGRSLAALLGDLVYRHGWFTPATALGVLAGLAAAAAFSRSREAWVAWLCFALSALPVALIPPRGVYAWYVPLAALWMLGGMALVRMPVGKPALWMAVSGLLLIAHTRAGERIPRFILDEQEVIAAVVDGLSRSPLGSGPDAGLLIVEDPFQGHAWGEWKSAMLIRLQTGRHDLLVQYPHERELVSGLTPLGWRNGRFERISGVSGDGEPGR